MDKMHEIAEAIIGEKLEVLPTYIKDYPPSNVNAGVYYISKSLELLAQADYFIGFTYYTLNDNYTGCRIETDVADCYDIPSISISTECGAKIILSDMYEGGLI